MAWERLLAKEQLEIIVDSEKAHLMLETSTGGAVPRFVTVHVSEERDIDDIIAALEKAKAIMRQAAREGNV